MNSERRYTILLAILLTVAVGGYTWWWFTNHELVEEQYRLQPSAEVRENPYRAAQLFLQEKGYNVDISSGLNRFQSLPSTDDMIIGARLGVRLPEQRVEEVLEWVAAGGQLLTSVQRSWSSRNPGAEDRLLSKLGIILLQYDDDAREQFAEDNDRYFDLTHTTLNNNEVMQAQFPYGLSLYDPGDRKTLYVSSESSNHIVLVPHGEGWVMLATSLTFMQNPGLLPNRQKQDSAPYINHRDHAFLLNWLAESNKTIWLVRGIEATPLADLLWQHASHAVIALIALVIIWLWWQYNRFGPFRSSTIPQRRNILEHLLMSAIYAWRQDRAQQLFNATRKDIDQLIHRKHPQIAALETAERTAKLAEHCEMTDRDIDRALHKEWNGEREFIELTYLLQQIRKKL